MDRSHTHLSPNNNSNSTWFLAFIVAGATIYFYWRKNRVNRAGGTTTTNTYDGNTTGDRQNQCSDRVSKTKNLSLRDIMLTKKYDEWKTAVDFRILLDLKAQRNGEYVLSTEGKKFLEHLLSLKCCIYLYCLVPREGYNELKKKASYTPTQEDKKDLVVTTPAMKKVLNVLKPFSAQGLIRDQVLFCSSTKALESFSRQIEPTLLLTAEANHMKVLAHHLPYIVFFGGEEFREVGANVVIFPSVSSLL